MEILRWNFCFDHLSNIYLFIYFFRKLSSYVENNRMPFKFFFFLKARMEISKIKNIDKFVL